ncbi:hypothetical protein ACR0ST_01765 [Aliidiomarina sp. Khilg15.8]
MQRDAMSWSTVYDIWKRTANACGHTPGLFLDVTFEEPELSQRYDEIQWWPSNGIEEAKQRCLDFWKEHPGTEGRTSVFELGRGSYYTLEFLWSQRASREHQTATFIAAFLFPYIGSTRSRLEYREVFDLGIEAGALSQLYRTCLNKAREHGEFTEWPAGCTEVLPELPELHPLKLPEIETLVRYITERFYLMLRSYQPVRLVYGEPKGQFSAFKPPY